MSVEHPKPCHVQQFEKGTMVWSECLDCRDKDIQIEQLKAAIREANEWRKRDQAAIRYLEGSMVNLRRGYVITADPMPEPKQGGNFRVGEP